MQEARRRLRARLNPVWPKPVERIAEVLRAARAEGRIEELSPTEERLPGVAVSPVAFDCAGAILIALVPAGCPPDVAKLEFASGLSALIAIPPPPFPYTAAARVLIEQLLLGEATVSLEAGSVRHVLVLAPAQLIRLTGAAPADISSGS